jgi:hypothetical protein
MMNSEVEQGFRKSWWTMKMVKMRYNENLRTAMEMTVWENDYCQARVRQSLADSYSMEEAAQMYCGV